jgi:hypothetical protein
MAAFAGGAAQAQVAGPSYTLSNPVPQAELREFCADRPGAGTPPCTLDAGHFAVEVGVFGAEFDRRDDGRSDTYTAVDLLFRAGLNASLEAQLAWTPYTSVRERDRATGVRSKVSGVGDVTFALRQNLANPDGSGFSMALQPFVTAPTGRDGIGDDGWSGGVILPVSIDLGSGWALGLAPEVARVGDADGDGHHLAYAGVIGVSRGFGDFSLGAELYSVVDDDPDGESDQSSVELSGTWVPPSLPNLQFDGGVNAGLDADTPDLAVYLGVARRF